MGQYFSIKVEFEMRLFLNHLYFCRSLPISIILCNEKIMNESRVAIRSRPHKILNPIVNTIQKEYPHIEII